MTLDSALLELREASLTALWRQWSSISSLIGSEQTATALIDPEALVLLSLDMRRENYRLWDVLSWFAVHQSRLLSMQRIKNLSKAFSDNVGKALQEFSYLAAHEGRDRRWASLASTKPTLLARSGKLKQRHIDLSDAASLMLRLRLGIGVGIKADILTVLIGSTGSVSVKALAVATQYYSRAVRRSADEMAAAQLISKRETPQTEYYADSRKWLHLLGLVPEQPKWNHLHLVFAFVSSVAAMFCGKPSELSDSSYATISHLRDIVEGSEAAFAWNQIPIPVITNYPGERFTEAFQQIVSNIVEWLNLNI